MKPKELSKNLTALEKDKLKELKVNFCHGIEGLLYKKKIQKNINQFIK